MGGREFGKRKTVAPLERRRTKRSPMGIDVSLYSVSQSRVVLMLDVSPTGARFQGHDLPSIGKDVLLVVDDVELFGAVIRSREGEAAIRFERPIGANELEMLQTALSEQSQVTIRDIR